MKNTYKVNEEAVKKIAERVYDNGSTVINRNDLEEMFPELAESEDERIREALIEYFRWNVQQILSDFDNKEVLAWLEKQKTSDKALQYLKENHSPSEVSDFQAAMNIAVAKAYDKGYNDGLKNQGEQKPAWSEEDESIWLSVLQDLQNIKDCHSKVNVEPEFNWLKSLKDRVQSQSQWKPSNLPHWKKSNLPNNNTTGFNSDYFCHKGYCINYKELFEKLPKND